MNPIPAAPEKISYCVAEDMRLLSALLEAVRQLESSCMIFGGILRDILCGSSSEDIDLMIQGELQPFSLLLVSNLTTEGLRPLRSSASPDGAVLSLYFDAPLINKANKIDLISSASKLFAQKTESLKTRLERADFTIDAFALLIEPFSISFLDPYNGAKDIQDKKLRIIRDSIFQDSPKTMLKALRLGHKIDFAFDARLEAALRDAAAARVLEKEDSRALYEAVIKLCAEREYLAIWEDLKKRDLLTQLFPPECVRESAQPPKEQFDFGASFRGEMRLASLLHDSTLTRQHLEKRFSLPPEEIADLFSTARAEQRFFKA